jgi:uncharacterized membrane protein
VNELWLFLGRFHPLLVHFPIGLLILAGILEGLAWRAARRGGALPEGGQGAASSAHRREGTTVVLVLAAAGACASALAGVMLGTAGGYGGGTFEWHERLGIATAVGSLATLLTWSIARQARAPRRAAVMHRFVLGATIALVIVAGHLGATLTHGEGYLTEHAPSPLRRWLTGLTAAPAAQPMSPGQTVVYTGLVQPILRSRCEACHGSGKAEGELRLDTPDHIRKGGSHGAVIVPGRSAASELVRRIWLPSSHEKAMPPGGRQPLPAADASILRWWVDQGAPFDKKLADLEIPADLEPVLEAMVGPLNRGGPTLPPIEVAAASADAINVAKQAGAAVVPLAGRTHFVEVHCTNAGKAFGDRQLEALAALAPQTVWLDLSGTSVTDAGLATVARFTNLTRLHLNQTAITDSGLAQLSKLQHLEYLNLYGTAVTDDGLSSLTDLRKLRTLYVWQTKVTGAGVSRLRTALPRLAVEAGAVESKAEG